MFVIFLKKKFGRPENFFLAFFTFQTIFSRFRPKKNFQIFFPPGRGQPSLPPWGKNFLKFFFWSKSTQNGLKREKKPKKFQGGGRAAPPGGVGGRNFFL